MHGRRHRRGATYFASLKVCGGQRTTRSALTLARGALPLGSNSTKLNSVPIIAYNSNVHFARNVPFSQTPSHIFHYTSIPDNHENICSPTLCQPGIINFGLYIQKLGLCYTWRILTSFSSSNSLGLQCFLHQGSMWLEKWNLSTTISVLEILSVVSVRMLLIGLRENLFKWHPSS